MRDTTTATTLSDLEGTNLTYAEKWHIVNTNRGWACKDCATCGTTDTTSPALRAEWAAEEKAIQRHEGSQR